MGDSLDAFHAGYKPATALIINESIQMLRRSVVLNTGVMWGWGGVLVPPWGLPPPGPTPLVKLDIAYAPPIPVVTPSVDPVIPMITASIKNKDRIRLFDAPIALSVPISNILSLTDVWIRNIH
jgi:hypothetical protein